MGKDIFPLLFMLISSPKELAIAFLSAYAAAQILNECNARLKQPESRHGVVYARSLFQEC